MEVSAVAHAGHRSGGCGECRYFGKSGVAGVTRGGLLAIAQRTAAVAVRLRKRRARDRWGVGAEWNHEGESAGLSAVPPSSLEAKRRRVSLTAFKAVIWPRPRCPRYVPAGARRVHWDAQSRETPSSKPGGSLQGRALHAKLRKAKHWPARRPAVAPAIFNANSARTSKRTSGACGCGSSGVLADGEWHMCGQICIFPVCSGCVVHCGT